LLKSLGKIGLLFRHPGARALAREPGIHDHRSANMDSGLAAARRPGIDGRI
jgi:hypothetical protein